MSRQKDGRKYQVFYACGNQATALMCDTVIFPAPNEFFLTVKGIIAPQDDAELEAKYIPKHLVLEVKVFKPEVQENNLRVVDLNAKVSK